MKQSRTRLTTWAGLLALLIAVPPLQAQETDEAPVKESQQTDVVQRHVVERSELVLYVRATGRLETDQKQPLVFRPQAYSGRLEVRSVKQRAGEVEVGDPIIQLDAPDYDDAVRSANEALADAQKKLAWAKQELAILTAQQDFDGATQQIALKRAEENAKRWEQIESADMLKQAELEMQGRIDRLDDEREELKQLIELYEDSRLADRTQDIVLNRTKRRLARAEEAFEIAKNEHEKITEIAYPRRDADVKRNLESKKMQHDHGKQQSAITLAKKKLEVEQATRAVRAASEKLVKLEADFEALCLKADQSGLVTGIDVRDGAIVQTGSPLGSIVDPNQPVLRVELAPSDLLVIKEETKVNLRLPEAPHVKLTGRVRSLDLVGRPSGDSTVFPATIIVNETHPLARIGMQCEMLAKNTLADTLTLPKSFVHTDNASGDTFCWIETDEGSERRDIVIGVSSDDDVEVIEGLEAGETALSREVE